MLGRDEIVKKRSHLGIVELEVHEIAGSLHDRLAQHVVVAHLLL